MSNHDRVVAEYDRLLKEGTIKIPTINKCIKCGKPLKLGEFAYDQNTCWKCFENQVHRIARNTETIEEANIVIHLLALAKEIHGIKEELK